MAELTFNSPIRREYWPRWMIKLHEYLTRIYERPVREPDFDEYDRLKRIIIEKIVALRTDRLIKHSTATFVYIVEGENGFLIPILRNNKIVITYYLE